MRSILKFETEDGSIFDTEEEAIAHEKWLIFEYWYERNRLDADAGSQCPYVSARNLLEYITRHKDILRPLLQKAGV